MDEQVAEQSKTSSEGIEHGSVPQEGAVVQTQQTARLEEGSDSSTPNTNHTDAAAEVETSSQSIKACGVPEEGTVDVRSQPAPKVEEVDDPSTVKPVDHSAEVETPSQGTDGVKLQPAPKVEEDDDTSSAKPVDDSAEGDHLAIELEANPTNKSSQGQEADKAVACSKAEAADVVSAKLLQDVEEEQQQEKENCDPCTRRALCPMNCLEPKCRMHLTSTLLLILSFFLFADQQLVAPNLSQIASEFNLTDEERDLILGGLVPLCFFAIGTPITIFIGPIIDRAHRRNLFVFLIFMGEIPCLCTQWVYSPAALLVTRAITGISMAGAEPLIFSMLSDMYGVKERNVMASVITIGQGAGLLAGQALAGFLGPTSGWRLPFLCVSIPSMAFSILMLCLVEEPLRGAGEESVREATAAAKNSGKEEDGTIYKSDLTCSKVCAIFRVPTNLLLYFSEIPSSMGWGVLFAFLTDFVATDKEFGVQNATTCVAILGVGLAIGAVAGGITGQYLNNNCAFKGSVAVMIGTTALLGPLPYYWVIYAPFYCEHDVDACLADADVDPTISPTDELYISTVNDCVDTTSHTVCPTHIWAVLISLLFISGLLLGVPNANARAMLLNTNLPETRGTAVAVLVVLSNLGKGTGPLIAAAMILSLGRQVAFTAICVVFSCASITYFITAVTYQKDIQNQVARVEAQLNASFMDRVKEDSTELDTVESIAEIAEIGLEMKDIAASPVDAPASESQVGDNESKEGPN